MITAADIMTLTKEQLPEAAQNMDASQLPELVERLADPKDGPRYQAFLTLQYRSRLKNDVYPFWETLCSKLTSDNSYQRSIGLMLIAENVQWDRENQMSAIMDKYLALLEDEKPITVRQCIQSLGIIVRAKPDLCAPIAGRLLTFDVMNIKETMRKSVLTDVLHVLMDIRKIAPSDELDHYIFSALTGGVLDKKTVKEIQAAL